MNPNNPTPIYKIPHKALLHAIEDALCDLSYHVTRLAADYPGIPLDHATRAHLANQLTALSAIISPLILQITTAHSPPGPPEPEP